MNELPLAELCAADVGLRVVVVADGNAFDGMLTTFSVTRSDYDFKDVPKVTARMTVKSGVGTLALEKLPLDYRIQIERDGATS